MTRINRGRMIFEAWRMGHSNLEIVVIVKISCSTRFIMENIIFHNSTWFLLKDWVQLYFSRSSYEGNEDHRINSLPQLMMLRRGGVCQWNVQPNLGLIFYGMPPTLNIASALTHSTPSTLAFHPGWELQAIGFAVVANLGNVEFAAFGLGKQEIYYYKVSKLVATFVNRWSCWQERSIKQISSLMVLCAFCIAKLAYYPMPSIDAI